MDDAWILSGCRTPIGRLMGALSPLGATQLGALVVRQSLARAGLDGEGVDEVIMGNVLGAGLGQAPARQAALGAGIRPAVSAVTVNKVCGSGLKAVMMAAGAIRLGDAEVCVAGGMESMSRAPHLMAEGRGSSKLGDRTLVDSLLHDGLMCAFEQCHMGNYAEHTARTDRITREDQDHYAAESQRRAAAAIASGAFSDQIVAVPVPGTDTTATMDEGPRPDTTPQALGKLKAAFEPGGTVTAGNASMLSDGGAAVVVTSRRYADSHGLVPMARVVAYATAGTEPRDLFIAPVFAVQKVLAKVALAVHDIDLFEINEAFAAQMLACIRRLELPRDRVNVHGGAIALGHPIGASGARVLVTLLHAMRERGVQRGLASLCLGGGNAVAMVLEQD